MPLTKQELKNVQEAFKALMGVNGDRYASEIIRDGKLSQTSYRDICGNISFNSKESIVQHFGLVHYYHLQSFK